MWGRTHRSTRARVPGQQVHCSWSYVNNDWRAGYSYPRPPAVCCLLRRPGQPAGHTLGHPTHLTVVPPRVRSTSGFQPPRSTRRGAHQPCTPSIWVSVPVPMCSAHGHTGGGSAERGPIPSIDQAQWRSAWCVRIASASNKVREDVHIRLNGMNASMTLKGGKAGHQCAHPEIPHSAMWRR